MYLIIKLINFKLIKYFNVWFGGIITTLFLLAIWFKFFLIRLILLLNFFQTCNDFFMFVFILIFIIIEKIKFLLLVFKWIWRCLIASSVLVSWCTWSSSRASFWILIELLIRLNSSVVGWSYWVLILFVICGEVFFWIWICLFNYW